MPSVGAFEAKTHLAQLLKRVAKGEIITITWHGQAVAKLVPAGAASGGLSRAEAVLRLKEFGRRHRLEGADWKAWRDQGRS